MGSTDGHEQEGTRPAVVITVVGAVITIVPCTSNLEC